MKRFICALLVFVLLFINTVSFCGSGETDIPSYTIEQRMVLSKSKQAKVDIIKKNNSEIETYKTLLSNGIIKAAEKINNLKLDITSNYSDISDDKLVELKELLEFIQESTKTLDEDATTVSREIDEILDLIISKGMKLEQYDQIIEKQNTLIVRMKNILVRVETI